MVSLGELLRDARFREEEERADAARRTREEQERREAARVLERQQEAARERAEEKQRTGRAFEERRRQAELVALQQASLERARLEVGTQARLAEMAALQDHERQLRSLAHDRQKRRLQVSLVGLGILLVGGAVAGGVTYGRMQHEKEAVEAHARELEGRIGEVQTERTKVERQLARATDPAEVARLQAELTRAKEKLEQLNREANRSSQPGAPPRRPSLGTLPPPPPAPARACSKGDPLCPTVN